MIVIHDSPRLYIIYMVNIIAIIEIKANALTYLYMSESKWNSDGFGYKIVRTSSPLAVLKPFLKIKVLNEFCLENIGIFN